MSGEHHDPYTIENILEDILALLEQSTINHKRLFLNADASFASKSVEIFRKIGNNRQYK
ncbi:hypothetical protein [Chryseobacterium sp. ERMR1:04]|uniref:hypothetical protein n=1 Tax=Chryseobacterium sp. ERMR1:04 TaxID=1705393 RepID=UPI000A736A0A|nr:hypothetical protein [Chryseobacterium sp. ERMR1:04]